MKRRLLVVYFSQSGQLRRALDSIVSGVDPGEFEIVFAPIRPARRYPFPWTVREFLGVFPEAVLGDGPGIEPLGILDGEKFDAVLIGATVWYLAPSPPIEAFLKSPEARALAGVPVFTLISCRNLWHAASLRLAALVAGAGGRHTDAAVITDRAPAWASFVTTPRWMLTGRRDRFWFFPQAGVADEDVATLRRLGAAMGGLARGGEGNAGRPLWAGLDPLPLGEGFLVTEAVAERVFRLAARGLRAAGPPGSLRRAWGTWLFAASLVLSILTLVPLTVLARPAIAVLFRKWYDARLRNLMAPSLRRPD